MFFALVQLGLIPLCLWLGLLLMESGAQTQRIRIQAKTDALSLSLCHQVRKQLEGPHRRWNISIEIHQNVMSAKVAACIVQASSLALTGGPPAFAARMQTCNLELIPMVKTGKNLEGLQNLDWKIYIPRLQLEAQRLVQANALNSVFDQTIGRQTIQDALVRADLNAYHRSMQDFISLFGQKREWPKILSAHKPHFSDLFVIRTRSSHELSIVRAQDVWSLDKHRTHQSGFCLLKELKKGKDYVVQP